MMSGKLNAWQSKPQQAGLNVHTNLHVSTIHHAHCSFTPWACVSLIGRQSALIAWHNTPFNIVKKFNIVYNSNLMVVTGYGLEGFLHLI